MDQKFKEWLISQHELADPETKHDFLQMLKFSPDKVLQIFSSHIRIWVTQANYYTRAKFEVHDCNQESQEILKAFQEHFAKELAAITK
jgi:hypothetical protein